MKIAATLLMLLCFFEPGFGQDAKPTERKSARDYFQQGMDDFRAARIPESIAAFEKAVRLVPNVKPQLWQLGISYYYAGEYEKGRRLFEAHQTVNPQDVENAIWHFLCVTRSDGIAAARKNFIRITDDRRVPMKELHALFAGKGDKDQVLAAARAGNPWPEELKGRLFYSHLYLGLHEEALSHPAESLAHVKQAAEEFGQPHYMWDVARIHLILRKSTSPAK